MVPTKKSSPLNLPISLESICLKNMTSNEIQRACKFACSDNSDIHQLPFLINEKELYDAIQNFQSLSTSYKTIFK